LVIQLTQPQQDVADDVRGGERTLHVPWRKVSPTRRREIVLPSTARHEARPMRSETRATLLAAIARGDAGCTSSSATGPRPPDPLRSARGVVCAG
jgi:hypothetical protein